MTTESIADTLDKVLPDDVTAAGATSIYAVKLCQRILADYMPPDSGISADECLNQLLQVLDDRRVVESLGPYHLPKV